MNIVSAIKYNHDINNIFVANNIIGIIGRYTNQANSILGYEVFRHGYTKLCHMVELYRGFIDTLPDRLAELVKSYV